MTERSSSSWLQRLWQTLSGQAPAPIPAPTPTATTALEPAPATAIRPVTPAAKPQPSTAQDETDYRLDCAQHLYQRYPKRIYQGLLPPMLYAIAVVEVFLDVDGHIAHINWMRKPDHALEVPLHIEQLLRAATPFPAAPHLGQVRYTDTWLWDESGQFQLHTLTEGQQ